MNMNQSAAYAFSMAVCALAEIEGMKAENMQREALGQSMAYGEESFTSVIDKYGIHHNGVITTINEAQD